MNELEEKELSLSQGVGEKDPRVQVKELEGEKSFSLDELKSYLKYLAPLEEKINVLDYLKDLVVLYNNDTDDSNEVYVRLNSHLKKMELLNPGDLIELILFNQILATSKIASAAASATLGESSVSYRPSRVRDLTAVNRSLTNLVDATVRYQRKGEQRVKVEHINVESGANAVIGSVTTRGGRKS